MGCPNIRLSHDEIDPDKLWRKLVHADNSNCTILAATNGDNQVCQGVVGGHAYSVIGVKELDYENTKVKLV